MKMKSKKKAAKKKVAARGKRYSDKRKATLLAKYHEIRKAGGTTDAAAKKLGVPYITLRAWEKKAGKPAAKEALKKAVAPRRGRKPGRKPGRPRKTAARKTAARKTAARKAVIKKAGGISLITPAGFRIEGISSADLVRVLKALK